MSIKERVKRLLEYYSDSDYQRDLARLKPAERIKVMIELTKLVHDTPDTNDVNIRIIRE